MKTLSSFSCQLRLGGYLSHLGLNYYKGLTVEAQYQAQILYLRPDLAIEQCSVVYLYFFHSINLVLKSHCGLYMQRSNAVSLGRYLG